MGINADFRDAIEALLDQHSMCALTDCCYDFEKVLKEYFK